MVRSLLFLAVMSVSLCGCYSLKKSVDNGKPYNDQIDWPPDYELDKTVFYIHNRIDINASPQTVWNILIQAEAWPDWYQGIREVKVLNDSDSTIKPDSKLTFNTMNRDFNGIIKEFKPYERLAWETIHEKLNAYHAWLIIPNENGCSVITDESQYGKLAKLQIIFVPNKLRKLHDKWLEELKKKAEL